jgi:hypothetical protein
MAEAQQYREQTIRFTVRPTILYWRARGTIEYKAGRFLDFHYDWSN